MTAVMERPARTTPATLERSQDEPAAVSVRAVTRRFGKGSGALTALDGIDVTVRPGEFVCLVGASGCGKSTLLHLIAGLDRPTTGTVNTSTPAALMFQEAALLPWLTCRRNVELALRAKGVPRAARRDRAEELLAAVHLAGVADRRPHELSGGMRQRVALARSLATDAGVLLMDEPFGALDAMTRDLMHDELESVWSQRAMAVVFVSHNVREAVRLGDRVLLLSSRPGRVVEEFTVDVPRPRRIESPEVSSLSGLITRRLREEVRRHAH